jgi:hypothetical protein
MTMRRQINGSISHSSMRSTTLAGFRTCFERFGLGTSHRTRQPHVRLYYSAVTNIGYRRSLEE